MTGHGPTNSVPPQPRLRLSVMLGLGVVVAGVGVLLMYGSWGWLPFPVMPTIPGMATGVQQDAMQLPAAFTRQANQYGVVALVNNPAPIVQVSQPDTRPDVGKASTQQSFLDTLNPFRGQAVPAHKEPDASAHASTPATKPQSTQETPPPPKPRKGWAFLAQPTAREASTAAVQPVGLPGQEEGPAGSPRVTQRQQGAEGSQDLIRPAKWAIPAEPLKTLYMSQPLPGRILDALQSDLPGRLRILLTINILDKFGYDTIILPKDTLIIAQQVSVPQYGQTRLQVKLIQLELPSGEVVSVKAMVGDEQGTNGLSGRTNNHYGKLLLATGISAVLNIGAQAATGTPGPQQFFRNAGQEAAQDIGQGIQQEAQKVVDRELRVPPTITRKAGTFCVITLEENLSFSRPPVIAR